MNARSFLKNSALARFLRPAIFLAITAIAAASQTTIGLAPAMVMEDFKPGQSFEMDFNIANGTSVPMQMHGSISDWWYNQKNDKIFSPASAAPYSAANWMEVVPRTFVVPANGTFRFKVIVTPPPTVTPGGHYAAVFIESKPELSQAATQEHKAVFTNIRMGALVLLTTEHSEKYDIVVSDPELTPPAGNRNLKAEILLENKSNTHIFPQVQLVVMNDKDEVVAKAQGETKRFLPKQKDHLSVSWDGTLPAGSYSAILTLIYGDGKVHAQDFKFRVPS